MEIFFTRIHFIIISATAATFIIFSDWSGIIQSKEKIPLFVFGDSYFDAGNNNYINTSNRANFYPYGETFFKNATGRFSDGRLIPDFIAEFAKLPLISPFLEKGQHKKWIYGVNFASGGGGALVETHAGMVIDLKTQLRYMENVEIELKMMIGNKKAKKLLSKSVFLFSVGINDLIGPSSVFSTYSPHDYVAIVIDNFTQVIKKLHKNGARKFGFLRLIPLNYLPFARAQKEGNGQYVEGLKNFTKLYNTAFAQKLQDLEKHLKGFRYSNFDSFTVVMDIIDNPSKYGFKDVENACCGSGAFRGAYTCGGTRGTKEYELCENPDNNLFFDPFHLGEKGHRLLADLMWHGGPKITGPSNLKSFF